MPDLTPNYSFYKPKVNDAVDQDLWGGYLNDNWASIDTILNTRTQAYNFADFELTRPTIKDYAETLNALGNQAGATVTVDLTLGNHVSMTLTGNISTLTINNPAPTGNSCFLILYITQDATGSRTFAWPSSFKWAGGTSPTVTATASRTDIFGAVTRNAGTTWAAFTSGQNFTGL
jgi:hypothetical protein